VLLKIKNAEKTFFYICGSRGGIVDRHVQCAQSSMHLVESAAPSGTVGCTLQWTLGAEINKQLQLLFATTLTLTLRHSDVIVV